LIKEYFDNLAGVWDKICVHDEKKIEYILNLLDISKTDAVLDCGCGTGILEKFLLNLSSDITAVDISSKMLRIAKNKYKGLGIKFLNADLFDVDIKFDFAILYNIYPHIFEKTKLSKKLYEILNPDGRFVIFHTDGKDALNKMHSIKASGLAVELNDVKIEKKHFEKLFDITMEIDNKDYFLISGIKRSGVKEKD